MWLNQAMHAAGATDGPDGSSSPPTTTIEEVSSGESEASPRPVAAWADGPATEGDGSCEACKGKHRAHTCAKKVGKKVGGNKAAVKGLAGRRPEGRLPTIADQVMVVGFQRMWRKRLAGRAAAAAAAEAAEAAEAQEPEAEPQVETPRTGAAAPLSRRSSARKPAAKPARFKDG